MAYSDEWFQEILRRRPWKEAQQPELRLGDVAPCEHATTWKPWAEMTAEERRKALSEREGATSSTPRR